jgi:hypothetical protein
MARDYAARQAGAVGEAGSEIDASRVWREVIPMAFS